MKIANMKGKKKGSKNPGLGQQTEIKIGIKVTTGRNLIGVMKYV